MFVFLLTLKERASMMGLNHLQLDGEISSHYQLVHYMIHGKGYLGQYIWVKSRYYSKYVSITVYLLGINTPFETMCHILDRDWQCICLVDWK